MTIAKLENKDVEELTLNSKNALGEVIQYDTTYFKDLEGNEITLNDGITYVQLVPKDYPVALN